MTPKYLSKIQSDVIYCIDKGNSRTGVVDWMVLEKHYKESDIHQAIDELVALELIEELYDHYLMVHWFSRDIKFSKSQDVYYYPGQ